MGFSVWHLLLVLAIVVIVFGAGRLPRVMGDIGKGIRSLREGLKGDEESPPSPAKHIDHAPGVTPPAAARKKHQKPRS